MIFTKTTVSFAFIAHRTLSICRKKSDWKELLRWLYIGLFMLFQKYCTYCVNQPTFSGWNDWRGLGENSAAILCWRAHRSRQSSRHFGVPPITAHKRPGGQRLEGREWVEDQLRPNVKTWKKSCDSWREKVDNRYNSCWIFCFRPNLTTQRSGIQKCSFVQYFRCNR